MTVRPARWLVWAPLAVLPFLAAWQLNSDSLERMLAARARSSLEGADAAWAKAEFDGRDALLSGEAPDERAASAATEVVAAIPGVRRVDHSAVKVIVQLPPPDFDQATIVTNKAKPVLRGRWPKDRAKTLSLALRDRTYRLGQDRELTTDGKGTWIWTPAEPLSDGSYDVTVEITDGSTAGSRKAAAGTLVIDTVPPPRPDFNPVKTTVPPDTLSGSWPESEATGLRVTLDGKTYTLHSDAALTSKAGLWTLKLAERLATGVHDLLVEAIDQAGNVGVLKLTGAIDVAPPPSPPSVDKYAGSDNTPALTGRWNEAAGHTLSIAIGGRTYEKGRDPDLTSDGEGGWMLAVPTPLKDGIYDVVAIAGGVAPDETVAEVEIDTAPPPAPTVKPGEGLPVTGTFDARQTSILSVTLAAKTYSLGADSALSAQGDAWILSPDVRLAGGTYDVAVVAADRFGNAAVDASKDELVISATEPPQPPQPPEPIVKAPTVERYAGNDDTPVIKGTFDSAATKSFSVAIGGQAYLLGKDPALQRDGEGGWSLAIAEPLKDGIYDVVATANDHVRDGTVAEVEIDTAPPEAPVVKTSTALPVTGTFAPRQSRIFRVTLAGKTYVLGEGGGLSAEGENWSLAPPDALPPGTYDVVAEAIDAFGNKATDASKDELVIAPPPVVMAEPTIDPLETLVARPVITGSWSEGIANSLTVSVDGKTYELGKDEALESAAGIWKLTVPTPLKDGVYPVEAISRSQTGQSLSARRDIVVDATGPAAPTVKLYAGDVSPSSITGTWAEGDAVSLTVTASGKTAALGTQSNLTSDGKGNWTLALSEALPVGSHDVEAVTADKRGRIASDQTRFEILIKEGVKTDPQPPAVDCDGSIAAVLKSQPIEFEPDRIKFAAQSAEALAEVATIAGKCPGERLEVGGHTDSVGSIAYNQALSEGRAVSVLRSLVSAGIEPARLMAVGYGEERPIASNDTPEGRSANRRIEIRVVK